MIPKFLRAFLRLLFKLLFIKQIEAPSQLTVIVGDK